MIRPKMLICDVAGWEPYLRPYACSNPCTCAGLNSVLIHYQRKKYIRKLQSQKTRTSSLVQQLYLSAVSLGSIAV